MAPDDDALDLDLLAASLRADAGDLGAFVEGLADKLEGVLPGRVSVERARRGLRSPKLVRKIVVDAGGERLELLRDGSAIETRCAHVSGGIVLKTVVLDTDSWLAALGAALSGEAARSEQTRQALARLLLD
ncbi:MAG: hypothetical protein ACR2LV_10770 [Solirubrobacteraceae bacterium]